MKLTLKLTLESDATFGRGDGVSGLVDLEVEHDAATGLPFVRGRTLKGLLVEECANILHALEMAKASGHGRFQEAAQRLFGIAGSSLTTGGAIHVGAAQLHEELCSAITADVEAGRLRPAEVLEMFTDIRRQTAVNEKTGVPEDKSLRSSRVLLRGTELFAQIDVALPEEDREALALLGACVAGLRRGGVGRNRGRGRLKASLEGQPAFTSLDDFEAIARGMS